MLRHARPACTLIDETTRTDSCDLAFVNVCFAKLSKTDSHVLCSRSAKSRRGDKAHRCLRRRTSGSVSADPNCSRKFVRHHHDIWLYSGTPHTADVFRSDVSACRSVALPGQHVVLLDLW